MDLKDKIRNDLIVAMKSKDINKTTLLRVIISEMTAFEKRLKDGKIFTDIEAIGVLQTLHSNAVEMNNEYEIIEIDKYLPSKLSEDELKTTIQNIISEKGFEGMKDMGKVMGILKNDYTGLYDGGIASQIVKNNL